MRLCDLYPYTVPLLAPSRMKEISGARLPFSQLQYWVQVFDDRLEQHCDLVNGGSKCGLVHLQRISNNILGDCMGQKLITKLGALDAPGILADFV